MKNSPASVPFVRLSCRIDAADIEAMLDAYDSGMCDISTANCISRAIARQLPCKAKVRLIRHRGNRADLEIHGYRIPLATELVKWLTMAETGGRVDPIEIVLYVPETGPVSSTIVRMTTTPAANPPGILDVSRKPTRRRPIAPLPMPQSGMEVTLEGIAADGNFIQMNEARPSGLRITREPEMDEYSRRF